MKHFLNVIQAVGQEKEDWFCKIHNRFVLKDGKWKPCKKKGNCVIGRKPKFQQIKLFS